MKQPAREEAASTLVLSSVLITGVVRLNINQHE